MKAEYTQLLAPAGSFDAFLAALAGGADATTTGMPECTYVLNTSSKKIHLPTCSSVNQIADKNKQYTTATREELIAQGYSPCGSCKP